MPPINQLSFGELRDKAKQILLRDSSRLAGTNYSPYPGQTIAPMSALTQRAQSLEQRRLNKGMPYQQGLSNLANAPTQGITPDNINSIVNNVGGSQANFDRNIALNKLTRQYGPRLEPYLPRLENKLQQDATTKLGELGSDIEGLNAPIRKLEGKKNRAAFTALSQSARAKESRERGLINDLYGYGEQKHGIINKGLTAEKARFEAERNDPYARLQNLQQALTNLSGGEGGDLAGHPDLDKLNAQQLTRALQAYGIDTGRPSEEWETANRVNTPVYPGQLVAPVNQTLDRSYKLAEELSPFYKERNYLDRKLTRKDVQNTPGSINRAVEGLPGQLNPKFEALDREAKRKLKSDINALNAKYIKQGTYGSQAHLQAVTNRTRELSEATLDSRNKATKENLLKGVTSNLYDDINKIGRLGEYDQLANTEQGNNLADIKATNLRGLEKWKNDQEQNEQLYRSYQNERSWQQPRLLNNARSTGVASGIDSGIGSVFNHFNNQGIDLSSISDLRNRYSELERELENRDSTIRSADEYRTRQEELARQNASEFERERNQRVNLERERNEFNQRLQQEIAARQQMEQDQQRRAELERQQRQLAERAAEAERVRATEQVRRETEQRLAEEARVRQQQEAQARAAEEQRVRQEQIRAEQARIAEQQRQVALQAQIQEQQKQDQEVDKILNPFLEKRAETLAGRQRWINAWVSGDKEGALKQALNSYGPIPPEKLALIRQAVRYNISRGRNPLIGLYNNTFEPQQLEELYRQGDETQAKMKDLATRLKISNPNLTPAELRRQAELAGIIRKTI